MFNCICLLNCRLELNDYVSVSNNTENAENQEDNPASTVNGNEMPLPLKKAYQIYQQAVQRINDIKFIIKLLTITEEYANTEKLQKKIVRYKYSDATNVMYFPFQVN